jgi:DNA-binding protein Fis
MDWYLCFVPHDSANASAYKENFFDNKISKDKDDKVKDNKVKDNKDQKNKTQDNKNMDSCHDLDKDLKIEEDVSNFYDDNYKNHDYDENKNIKSIAKDTLSSYSKKKNVNRPQISDLYNVINEELDCPDLDRIVAQYVFGNPTNLDAQLLDAAIYAFVEIRPDGTLLVPTPNFLRQMVNLKAEKPSLKVIAAIGGWGVDGFRKPSIKHPKPQSIASTVFQLMYNILKRIW